MLKACLFISASASENFGIAIAEALSSCVPVICTKGTPWESVQSEKCGWWIDDDIESIDLALTEALSLCIDDLIAMGVRGRCFIAREYSWESVSSRMLQEYQAIFAR